MMIQVDYRLGNRPRYYVASEGDSLMQVPDEIRKCVVFVCYRDLNGNIALGGTAFSVAVVIDNLYFPYVVTAKHVLVGIQRKSVDRKALLRVNMVSGPSQYIETDLDNWKDHPDDSSVDASVLPLGFPVNIYDSMTIPVEMVVTNEVIAREGIGIGDDIFLTGLFVNHHGDNKNLPIVRVGNIALMPEERIKTPDFGAMDAYLVEARSIGGLSGSPVFVHLGSNRIFGSSVIIGGGQRFYWLGLMHGHWDIENTGGDALSEDTLNRERVNKGIAIVVPAERIMEVINQKVLKKMRDKLIQDQQSKTLPTADGVPSELTKDEFEDTLRKVSRKIKASEPVPETS